MILDAQDGFYTVFVKVDGATATPKRWRFVRGHDKPIHGSCAIYFPGGIDSLLRYLVVSPLFPVLYIRERERERVMFSSYRMGNHP